MDTQIKIINDRAYGEEDEMSQTDIHNFVINYLLGVLFHLFANQNTGVFTSIDLYGDPEHPRQNKSPDILVIDGIKTRHGQAIKSYTIDEQHAPPRVLMEINSTSNWLTDLDEKYHVYERMRIPEYFVCDPQPERVWTGVWSEEPRLIGWRYSTLIQGFVRIPEEPQGLWSEQLESYLRMEGATGTELHLYDREGNRRLSEDANRARIAEQRANDAEQRAKNEEQEKLKLQKQLEDFLKKFGQTDQT